MADVISGQSARWLGSAVIRQTLILIAVFLMVDIASLGVAYLKLRADLRGELQDLLNDEVASFEVSATPRAMAAIVGARARVSSPESKVIVFFRDDGGQIGNARAMMSGGEMTIVPLDGGAPLAPEGYLQRVREQEGGILLVGVSLHPLAELRDTFIALLILSLVPTALVSILSAAILSRQNAYRVSQIESTLGRMSQGDLGARVGNPGGSDDLARIAIGVNRMAEKQEASVAALKQVTTDIAHDLKTPVQRLAVVLSELAEHVGDNAENAGLLEAAQQEVDRAAGIFDAMLRIAQIEGGGLSRGFAEVDLCDVARRVSELHEASIEDGGRALRLSLPESPVLVSGDQDLIAQGLSNLLENAERHTPTGTTIAVLVKSGGSGPGLIVADDGPGIPKDERARVRQRFYRLERSRTTPGNGLGLAMVSAIAALHGCRFDLSDNAPGLVASLVFPAPARPADPK
jgi:signal transduction histidine kinase